MVKYYGPFTNCRNLFQIQNVSWTIDCINCARNSTLFSKLRYPVLNFTEKFNQSSFQISVPIRTNLMWYYFNISINRTKMQECCVYHIRLIVSVLNHDASNIFSVINFNTYLRYFQAHFAKHQIVSRHHSLSRHKFIRKSFQVLM